MDDHRDVFDTNIASMTKFYESTGNVAAAWCAFSIAFTHGREIPDSIFKEVERFAAGIALTAEKAITADFTRPVAKSGPQKSRRKNGAITLTPEELSKLWRGTDKRDPVGRLHKEWRDYQFYWLLRNRIIGKGMTVNKAASEVSKLPGALSERSLQNLWSRLNDDG